MTRTGPGTPPHSPWLAPAFDVQLSVTVHGREIATRTVHRDWMSPGVTHRTLDKATDKATGELFLPAAGGTPHPAVLVFGGSEGGVGMTFDAALLASHGYPALALGYFGAPGLPPTLQDIPLEYFAGAAHVLSAQPVVVDGYSRGTEAALLLAQYYPGAGHGVGTFPYLPEGTTAVQPVTGATLPLGGTRAANAAARSDGWPKVLAWLATVTMQ